VVTLLVFLAVAGNAAAARLRPANSLGHRLAGEGPGPGATTRLPGPDDESGRCVNGFSDDFPCLNIRLFGHITLEDMDAHDGNDIWGWTDPETDKEYALIGLDNGLGIIDVSIPLKPQYLGKLPTQTGNSLWRGVKVFANHAYVVSEAPNHGLQVMDLTRVREVDNPPVTFAIDRHYDEFGNAHNIAINEETGFAYAVGSDTCSGGLHMIDINSPTNPSFAGCYSDDGYTHDTQCVVYKGPDETFQGREICFNANEDTLTIVDVTDKANPALLAREGYEGSGYTHQGWLTEDHAYFLLDDELDEMSLGHNTRTYIWDVRQLGQPQVIGTYTGEVAAIDHNLYVHEGYVYEANYRSGLRVLDAVDVANGTLEEIAFFDTYPENDFANFDGAWSVYPFFESGTIVVGDINRGLFVLQLDFPVEPPPASLIHLPLALRP
jgi:choice-of-anchor B domain-containing protein